MRPADKLQLKAATILPLLDSPGPSKTQSTVGICVYCFDNSSNSLVDHIVITSVVRKAFVPAHNEPCISNVEN